MFGEKEKKRNLQKKQTKLRYLRERSKPRQSITS